MDSSHNLLHFVSQRPILYNTNHNNYPNNQVKDNTVYMHMYVFMYKAAADEDGNVADILLITLYVAGFCSRGNLLDLKCKMTKSDREG